MHVTAHVIYDVAIVGAGLHGLSTAWNLPGHSVVVLEQFALGHHRGSSHGATRITRSSYADAAYVELMRVTRTEDWPRLERDAGIPLITPCDGVFFGPRGGLFDAFARQSYGDDVELVSRERARQRFPQLTFPDSPEVLIDRTAGVVDAEATMAALARTIRARGVTIVEQCEVQSWTIGDPIEITTRRGAFRAHRLVITAGPWAHKLLGLPVRPVRQTVGFFRCASPLFVHLGATSDDLHYGLPSRDVFKAARHASLGNDDPDVAVEADAGALSAIEAFLGEHLTTPPGAPLSAETCFFTMSAREDYVLDLIEPRIAVGAGFSGHGFKLGPTSGRILAELVTTGRTTVEPFERRRAQFSLSDSIG